MRKYLNISVFVMTVACAIPSAPAVASGGDHSIRDQLCKLLCPNEGGNLCLCDMYPMSVPQDTAAP